MSVEPAEAQGNGGDDEYAALAELEEEPEPKPEYSASRWRAVGTLTAGLTSGFAVGFQLDLGYLSQGLGTILMAGFCHLPEATPRLRERLDVDDEDMVHMHSVEVGVGFSLQL